MAKSLYYEKISSAHYSVKNSLIKRMYKYNKEEDAFVWREILAEILIWNFVIQE